MVMQILLFFTRLSNLSLFFSIIWLFYFYCLPLLHNQTRRLQLAYYTCLLAIGYWLLAFGYWLLAVNRCHAAFNQQSLIAINLSPRDN